MRRALRHAATMLMAAAMVVATGHPSIAAPGDRDSTFGVGGQALLHLGTTGDRAYAAAAQSDGKVVAVGRSTSTSGGDVAMARFTTGGVPDTTFGGGDGIVLTDLTPFDASSSDVGLDVAIQPDGKIVVVGSRTAPGQHATFAVVRYLATGSIDQNFGSLGIRTISFPCRGCTDASAGASAVAITAEGKIVVAGSRAVDIGTPEERRDIAVARLTSTGTLDTTFSLDGILTTDLGSTYDLASDVVLHTSGRIVVIGRTGFPKATIAVVRYMSSGAFDTTFSGDGKVATAFGANAIATSGVLLGSGNLLVAGSRRTTAGSEDFAFVRYTNGGALDTTFSGDGKHAISPSSGSDNVTGLALQSDGKIVASGYAGTQIGVVRLTSSGGADTTFSGDGKLLDTFGGTSAPSAMVLSSGRIVVVGWTTRSSTGDDFTLIRYLA
jgi:uncharacterized delta-60 repeat protein